MKSLLTARARAFAVVFALAAGLAAADQILEVYADTLTSYLAGTTGVQGVKPRAEQRAVNVDGSPREPSTFQMAIAGNPFESVWRGHETKHNGVRLDTGTWAPTEIDLSLPAPGAGSWAIARSYNFRQDDSGQFTNDGYQGRGWFQCSQPEIVLYEGATDDLDVIYLVLGADRYAEFQRDGVSSNQFKGKNGAAGVFDYQAGSPDLYVYTDQVGVEFTFFGFDTTDGDGDGQLWTIEDPEGNKAYVGDSSTASTAVANGFDDDGRILYAYDSADRRYTYTYTTLNSVKRLTEVKAETKTGGTWASPTGVTEVAKAEYTYYGDESYGDIGDLETVTLTTPLSDSGISDIRTKYYRYWEGSSDDVPAYNATTNPGYPHALMLIVDYEGVRNYDWSVDSTFDDDHLSASTETLKPYASAYLEYDSSHRVNEAWFNGACGCSGAGTGTHEYTYETNGSHPAGAGYDEEWLRRTVVERPDNSFITQYFDEAGQPLSLVVTNTDPASSPSETWVHHIDRDGATGCVMSYSTPANLKTYTHGSGAITALLSTDTSPKLYWDYDRTGSGNLTGFLTAIKRSKGSDGTDEYFTSFAWTSATKAITDVTVVRPLLNKRRDYDDTGVTMESLSDEVKVSTFAAYSSPDTLSIERIQNDDPIVASGNNGSGSADVLHEHLSKDGDVDLTIERGGTITYREYTNGQLTKLIRDADTYQNGAGQDFENVTVPTTPVDFRSTGTELHEKTEYAFDAQGRLEETTLPGGRVTKHYYTKLGDRRLVRLTYPKYVTGSGTFHGPVQYTVTNHAGKVEVQGVIEISGNSTTTGIASHIDETDADPITAVDTGSSFGSVAQMTTNHYDESGTVLEQTRAYFSIPASEPGTDGTHYDPTFYGYDDSGRRWRTKEASGTIRRQVYDLHGRVTEQWIGTNDSTFSGGEPSGTDNMVKTEALEFDSGNDGDNGNLTKRTLYVEDSATDKRESTYSYTWRGWRVAEVNPVAPHLVHDYDNQGRRTVTAGYSSSSGLGVASVPTTTTNRVSYGATSYDEKGRVWKTVRHKIDVDDGSDDDSLDAQTWYDEEGRTVKRDGEQLQKWAYDRLGRQTHEFTLAEDNDTAYPHADDVTGDIVLVERQTTYEAGGNVLMVATIDRHHDDKGASETTGALDTNADADSLLYTATNVEGRIQITAMWYDGIDRLEDRVAYGTYGGSNFDRDGLSVPARSDTALRTTNTYNDDGTLKEVTDPRGLKTRHEYDALGRQTKVIGNYDDGTPGGTDGDEDQTVAYAYTDGLRVTITADLPAGETDQVTTYSYGTTKGATAGDSNIATGHLLQEVKYPDSVSASDVVSYAYNARGQVIWKEDQAGNIIETDFDDGGREEHRRVTTIDADFDNAVLRISTTYDSRGMRELVTQYDNATVGSGSVVDEVKSSYDDWGNLSTFEQDINSAVGASGSVDDYEVSYTYAKATSGRNTIRRATQVQPNGNTLTYDYLSATNLHDDAASRVTRIRDGEPVLVAYRYNGLDQVVATQYDIPDVMWAMYGSTSGDYPDLDRFNRVTSSRWTKDLATDVDFFDTDIAYDRSSNITSVVDNVHTGFDVIYDIDDLDRVERAEEGTKSGATITNRTRDQQWTLTQTGNWNVDKVDLNGDGDFIDTDEVNDDRTHNDVNELTGRDTDDNGTDDYTLVYDEAGNLTDDGENYEYVWDAFYRLRKVNDTSDQSLVAEYKYNGLGYRISIHEDTDTDGDVDASDKWFHSAYDERWRVVGTFREDDSNPKEQFVYHTAGNGGYGSGSYIDLVVLRDKDANTAWTSASDGTLEERIYYCQNWRADVVALVDSSGQMLEWAKYSAYGVPFGLPGGDTDSDGDCDSTDVTQVQTWIDASAYDVRGDIDLDGDVDTTDKSTVVAEYEGLSLGRGSLSSAQVSNGRGMTGQDLLRTSEYSVRNRNLNAFYGVWGQRDQLEYEDGANMYAALRGNPLRWRDPSGLVCEGATDNQTLERTTPCVGPNCESGCKPWGGGGVKKKCIEFCKKHEGITLFGFLSSKKCVPGGWGSSYDSECIPTGPTIIVPGEVIKMGSKLKETLTYFCVCTEVEGKQNK